MLIAGQASSSLATADLWSSLPTAFRFPISDFRSTLRAVQSAIDGFVQFLAVERGLSENYQLSTRRSLEEFAAWAKDRKSVESARDVDLAMISEYLADRKARRIVGLIDQTDRGRAQDFLSSSRGKRKLKRDPTEALSLPRIERYLPETLNELQVQQLIESVDATQAARSARPRDPGIALRQRSAHLRVVTRAPGKFFER